MLEATAIIVSDRIREWLSKVDRLASILATISRATPFHVDVARDMTMLFVALPLKWRT
jgi:hypothetical protein